ncbi:hypothetical protein FACS1894155_05100 [Bacteroidia bacterium]|nr:hypothetical protein FACS1894155_05100 [Bacteroidia bacterium]
MKKIYSLISFLLLFSLTVSAQVPANRTVKTIVADVLAQMPAQRTNQYNNLIKDLSTTGEEGVLQLVGMLNPPGKGSNAGVEYALSGLAHYATGEGQETVRLTTVNALLKALDQVTDPNIKTFVIDQIGIAGKDEAVARLSAYLQDKALSDPATRALAFIGTPAAKKALSAVLNTTSDKPKKETGLQPSREASLGTLMASKPADVLKLLQKALKDPDRKYRYAALTFASDYATKDMYSSLLQSLKKLKPETQSDVVNWLGTECDRPGKRELIAQTATPVLTGLLSANDPELKASVVRTLVKTGGEQAIQALAGLLNVNDEKTVNLAYQALLTTRGNISDAVAPVIATAGDTGKIAGLKLLAHRRSNKHINVVIDQINNGTPGVKTAAYAALKDVVSSGELTTLYGLLEKAPADAIVPVQQAIAAAVKSYPAGQKLEIIISKINQAGDKRYLYYPLLATTGDPQALAIITDRFSGENGKAKEAAFQALLDWKGVEATGELYKIARNISDPAYRDKAIDRYIQLASDPNLSGENRRLLLTQALEIAYTDARKNIILEQLGKTNSFLGLLLAGQYLDVPAQQQSAAGAVMNLVLNSQFTGKNVKALLNKAAPVLNNPDADYQRQSIRKYLSEMPDEEGFISIFDGKDLTGWKGLVGTPLTRLKMKADELAKAQKAADEQMRRDWVVEDGLLVYAGKGFDNICTVKNYGDIEMYLDWKLDPIGSEPDAGVYLRGTPQVQIWDINRKNVGAEVGSGGLYNNRKNPSKPTQVADNKLGTWNTFYIKMVGDRVTVKLNGETVVDNVILENYWDRNQPIPALEQIELQAHGSKVYYRNIYVKELERPEPFRLSDEEKKEGFKILFDGTNMHEWQGNTVDYRLEDGCISLYPSRSFGGNLYTAKEYGNFIFRFEFQLTPSANNGVGIRAEQGKDAAYHGMEIQILDHDHPAYKDIAPYQAHGSVYGIIPAERTGLKPVGEWNYEEIVADGDHIKVTLNGEVIVDGNIREAVKNGTIDHKEHPGLFNKKGYIGFLGHGSYVKFKNIRVKELP